MPLVTKVHFKAIRGYKHEEEDIKTNVYLFAFAVKNINIQVQMFID